MNMPTKNLNDFRAWAAVHAQRWGVDPQAIGLSPQFAAEFAAAVADVQAAADAAEEARLASVLATQRYHLAIEKAQRLGSGGIATIKGYAKVTGDEGVYTASGVSADSPKGTLPTPTPPTDFSAQVNTRGELELKWKARQPRGLESVQYRVSRQIQGEAGFTMIGTAGSSKRFVDGTIPLGTARVTYLVTPYRGDERGPTGNAFTFQFGVDPATAQAARLAA